MRGLGSIRSRRCWGSGWLLLIRHRMVHVLRRWSIIIRHCRSRRNCSAGSRRGAARERHRRHRIGERIGLIRLGIRLSITGASRRRAIGLTCPLPLRCRRVRHCLCILSDENLEIEKKIDGTGRQRGREQPNTGERGAIKRCLRILEKEMYLG